MLRQRRRHRYGAHICALLAAVLLLLSVTLLYSRINFFQSHSTGPHQHSYSQYDGVSLTDNPLVEDSTDSLDHASNSDDLIDEQDDAVLNTKYSNSNGDDFLLGGESEEDVEDEDDDVVSGQNDKSKSSSSSSSSSSLYYFDHQNGVVRRGFNKKSIEEWEDYVGFESKLGLELGFSNRGSKTAFGSDDIPVDEKTRKKLTEVKGIEDALLLKGSKLREGWGEWFDKKSDFLRRDRMFKSNLEAVNPMNNPILQDPDMPGVTVLTRGDKLVQKGMLNEFKKVPFLVKKPLAFENKQSVEKDENVEVQKDEMKKIKMNKRKTLDNANSQSSYTRKNEIKNNGSGNHGYIVKQVDNRKDLNGNGEKREGKNVKNEFSGLVFADGRRWGYYPGLDSRLSFNNFMDAFFRKGKCNLRVFMVWNSPPWMFSVRYQRGLESVLYHHPDACVVVFSETLELNFFSSFVEDGFKVAVVMPNLDELLQDTPTHIFASVWYEWKTTKYYPIHYSELIRLAALYKYGGIYLDSDVIVLKKLSLLNCTVGLEDEQKENTLSGAVMAFRKHSPFIMECLTEFYASYDDTQLRWNGADLLTRVALNFSSNKNHFDKRMELRVLPSFVFFPISRSNISRYFSAPATDTERTEQDFLLNKILNKSVTVHYWNSLTSSLIPEPESLVSRLINQPCIRCSDVL
ncbi:uncharacterized protein At4g19900 [Coffea eugenioides]|uniref:uncharacterized protein At4g19900 n=1 Tax=Coffea eugenioides TaxID=49369 RepID=UPI000F60EF6D|nr:uncharacterized protein At4g19900 [Coffea eugenioides]